MYFIYTFLLGVPRFKIFVNGIYCFKEKFIEFSFYKTYMSNSHESENSKYVF
jgi:hypothetical protein